MNQEEYPIDVREIPPKQKSSTIFRAWKELKTGEVLVLINDHDPLPLYYQFACEYVGQFFWEYIERGPEVWRVRVTKGDYAHPGFVPQSKQASVSGPSIWNSKEPVVVDTRPIFARDETPCTAIDSAVAKLEPGQPLVVLVPFEPVPLYSKFGKDGFSHQTKQLEDGTWRVEFRKVSCCCSEA